MEPGCCAAGETVTKSGFICFFRSKLKVLGKIVALLQAGHDVQLDVSGKPVSSLTCSNQMLWEFMQLRTSNCKNVSLVVNAFHKSPLSLL